MEYEKIFDEYEKTLNACRLVARDSLLTKKSLKTFQILRREIVKCLKLNAQNHKRVNQLRRWIEDKKPIEFFLDIAVIQTVDSKFFESYISEEKAANLLKDANRYLKEVEGYVIDNYTLFLLLKASIEELKREEDNLYYTEVMNIYESVISKPNRYFNTKVYEICNELASASSVGQVWDKYRKYKNELHEITFLYANNQVRDGFKPIDLYQIFDDIPEVKNNVFALFPFGKVNYFSRATLLNNRTSGYSERLISFDKNTISYFRAVKQGKKQNLPQVAQQNIEILMELIKGYGRWQFNFLPYLIEDKLSDNYNENKVLEAIYEIEKTYYASICKSDEFCLEKAKEQISMREAFLEECGRRFEPIHCMLLAICFVQLQYPKLTAKQKLEMLFSLFDIDSYELCRPMTELAYDYYKGCGGEYFFRKIQSKAKNIVKEIKNMAWDIFHLKSLEWEYVLYDSIADINFPYFCTYDAGILEELKKYFELDALAVCSRTKETFPFYHYKHLPEDIGRRYFNHAEEIKRKSNNSECDFKKIIEKYELAINNLTKLNDGK